MAIRTIKKWTNMVMFNQCTFILLFSGILLHAIAAMSQIDSLKGNLSGKKFLPGGIYLVNDNIYVYTSDTVIIPEGSIFLFKPFTSMKIEGKLIVEGTENKPVIFTSYNDTSIVVPGRESVSQDIRLAPEPFDWNGIVISYTADTAELYFFEIRYATFGLKCEYDKLNIYQGKFISNGQYHLTIHGKIMDVFDKVGYTYPIGFSKMLHAGAKADSIVIPNKIEAKGEAVTKKRNRAIVPAISGGTGVMLFSLGIAFNRNLGNINRDVTLNKSKYLSSTDPLEIQQFRIKDQQLRNDAVSYSSIRNTMYILGALFLSGCGITIIMEI